MTPDPKASERHKTTMYEPGSIYRESRCVLKDGWAAQEQEQNLEERLSLFFRFEREFDYGEKSRYLICRLTKIARSP